jgi:hypothetical protein
VLGERSFEHPVRLLMQFHTHDISGAALKSSSTHRRAGQPH